MAEFVFLINGDIKKFDRYEDIPSKFDNVIKFKPDFSEGPHSHEEHEELEMWNNRLKKLMEKEIASRNKNR
jgi:hypothetical protein